MKQITLVGLVFGVVFMTLLANAQDSNALRINEEYVIFSDKYFVVFETDEDKKVFFKDAGIWYNDRWQIVNSTSVEVQQLHDEGNIGWFIGNLETGEQFWFTWNLEINDNVVTGTWVYDGITLTEMTDYKAYMTRLFF